MADVHVYRAEGQAVLDGGDLYGFTVTEWELPATYPPFAALLFVPFALLPLAAVKVLFAAGNAALLAFLVHLSLRAAGRPGAARSLPVLCTATALGLWLEPVFQTLVFGQINLLLACLVLWDLGRPDGARGKGLAIGVAAGIKLTPAVFAVHLLLTGRVREGFTAVAGFAGTVVLGAAFLPGAGVDFWTRRLWETSRVGKAWIVDNQSLQGLVARLDHAAHPGLLWLVPAAVVALAGLLLARHVSLRYDDAWGVQLTAVTALLVSPISWSHHWVWCVPLIVLTWTTAGRARTALAAALTVLFTARSMWLLPKEGDLDLHLSWWQQPLASPYPLLGLVLLAAVPLCLRRTRPEPEPRRRAEPEDRQSGDPSGRSCASTIR
ncbi:DUF2029 domain-containing protein [Streptomyces sp. HNM0574]|nr:DUF2029 domain-containing protein [Streptomyces sp. HNM0574]